MTGLYDEFHLGSTTSIRVFSIFPETEAGPVRCRLYTLERNAGQYIALSYVWGSDAEREDILVEGHLISVPANLVSCIKKLRRFSRATATDTPYRFWADAICINQQDESEKSHQVRQMKEIFEHALQIFAWLGPAECNSDMAIDFIGELEADWLARRETSGDMAVAIFQEARAGIEIIEKGSNGDNDAVGKWFVLIRLFMRPWWGRTWILQEATTENTTTIHCGDKYISIREAWIASIYLLRFLSLWRVFNERNSDEPLWKGPRTRDWLERGPINNILQLEAFKDKRKDLRGSTTPLALTSALSCFRHAGVTDLRDKVYAPLNIFDHQAFKSLEIDYTISPEQLYLNFATSCITQTDPPNLIVLGHCIANPDIESDPLPTWVPHWEKHTNQCPMRKRLSDKHAQDSPPSYSADSRLESLVSSDDNLSPRVDGPLLIVHGLLVDKLSSLSTPARLSGTTAVHRSWAPAPTESDQEYFLTRETVQDAYLRIIVMDLINVDDQTYRRGGKMSLELADTQPEPGLHGYPSPLHDRCRSDAVIDRRFARTPRGLMGLVPMEAREGDGVYALYGGTVLYVLREYGDYFIFIGECYIHGLMDGEVVDFVDADRRRLEKLVIK